MASAGQGARAALEELCASYWFPVYAFVRRRGHDADEARDLTQGFFADLLARDGLARADAARGRFRSFLLASCSNFLSHQRERALAARRGGGAMRFAVDLETAEERYHADLADGRTPESEFERRWAMTVLARALGHLGDEMEAKGQGERFARLKELLAGGDGRAAEVAASLGLTGNALQVALHRLRRRYRELLRAEIGETLADAAQLDEEMGHLMAALRGR